MGHTLYAIHGSHPCICAERALQLKRQPYRVVELPPALHAAVLWARFRHRTVPVLVLGSGETIVGSRAIVHRLDQLVPSSPLLPDEPGLRERVEDAERWGDEVLQPLVRRLFWVGIQHAPQAIGSYAEGSRLPIPAPAQRLSLPLIGLVERRLINHADDATARADLAALPALLDRVDALIADGTIGGEQPNAADLQIGPSVRFLGTFADVWPLLAGRPAWTLAQRLFPQYPGALPAGALPASAPAARALATA